jgi:hypothetical protein
MRKVSNYKRGLGAKSAKGYQRLRCNVHWKACKSCDRSDATIAGKFTVLSEIRKNAAKA